MEIVKRLQRLSRQRKLDYLLNAFHPAPEDKVIAVGVDPTELHEFSNYVEYNYPYRDSVTGVTIIPPERWSPQASIKLVHGDGRSLPFPDNSFDIAISNAVIEHVGMLEDQKRFIEELCRVAPKVFVTTPNFYFPFELHTRLPFIQFLPAGMRTKILNRMGLDYWAREWGKSFNLLSAKQLRRFFPGDFDVRIISLRITLLAESIVAIANKKSLPQ